MVQSPPTAPPHDRPELTLRLIDIPPKSCEDVNDLASGTRGLLVFDQATCSSTIIFPGRPAPSLRVPLDLADLLYLPRGSRQFPDVRYAARHTVVPDANATPL